MALAVFHAFEPEPVGIEKEDGIVVIIILSGRIDDFRAGLFKEIPKRIDILAASELKSIMVKADIAGAMFVFQAFLIGGTDPEPRLAIRPADRIVIFIRDLKAEESEEMAIEGFRFLIVTDPDDDMV